MQEKLKKDSRLKKQLVIEFDFQSRFKNFQGISLSVLKFFYG